jgi:thiamine biosynthesis protein ThiS
VQVIVNGDAQTLSDGATVAGLLVQHDLIPQRVAVEVNEQLVRRAEYAQTPLREGDRVEIVTLVGGG